MKIFLAVTAALGLGFISQDPFENATAETELVDGAVHMLTGRGGNIGFSIGGDGVLMIDSQYAPMEEKIREALAKLTDDKPKYLVNTHWHGDHTGGNVAFSPDALIVAHENVRKRLLESGRDRGPDAADALPGITFNDSISFHFNAEKVEALHLPNGHTDGDTIVIFHGSKVVHMGDHFFSGMFPFIDPKSGGSVQGYMKNMEAVLENTPKDWKIIPGHGPLSTHADLKSALNMMHATSAIVQKRVEEGKSLKAVLTEGLPSEWDSWSWNFISTERWIETLYHAHAKD